MTFLEDTFTDVEGTLLTAHTGEVGATWAKVTGIAGNAEIASNRARGSSSTTAHHYASGAPASAEYDIEAVIRRVTDLGNLRVYGRMSTTEDTGYGVRYNGGATNAWELHKVVAATTTLLGSWAETFADGTERTVVLEIRDGAKKVYIDGVERISSANNDITAAGRVGLRFFAASAPSDATAYHITSITASDGPTNVSGSDSGAVSDSSSLDAGSATQVAATDSATGVEGDTFLDDASSDIEGTLTETAALTVEDDDPSTDSGTLTDTATVAATLASSDSAAAGEFSSGGAPPSASSTLRRLGSSRGVLLLGGLRRHPDN